MTQQPYGYPPQPYPPAGYPAAPQYPQAPPQPQFYAPPAPQAPPTPPPAPIVSGTIDQFYNQPSAAGGPGISWKDKPIGTSYAGIISGVCRVQQDTDFDTGRPLFQRDQVTPKWVMMIPLSSVQSNVPTPEFPDGEAVFYVRGQARDELVRAMAEAHCSGEPQQGATFQVTLTHRKPNRKGNPSNIVQINYVPPGGVAHNGQAADQPAQQAPVEQPAPVQQQIQPVPMPAYAGPGQVGQPQAPQYAAPQVPQQQVQAPVAPQQPAPPTQPLGQPQPVQPQGGVQMPEGLTPEQQALFARIAGQGQPAA